MRRDLIIGVIVALAVHAGVAWVGQMSKKGAPPKAKEEEAKLIQIKPPDLDEPEPEQEQEQQQEVKKEFLPPQQRDVPAPPRPDAFVQKIQPPPPDSKPMTGSINIPLSKLAGLGEIFDPSKLDQIPAVKVQLKPDYPFEMRRAGVGGTVTVEFIVDSNGNVPTAWATKSTDKAFERNAQAAVMKWKFSPGRKGGRAVATHMVVDIVFNLNDLK